MGNLMEADATNSFMNPVFQSCCHPTWEQILLKKAKHVILGLYGTQRSEILKCIFCFWMVLEVLMRFEMMLNVIARHSHNCCFENIRWRPKYELSKTRVLLTVALEVSSSRSLMSRCSGLLRKQTQLRPLVWCSLSMKDDSSFQLGQILH